MPKWGLFLMKINLQKKNRNRKMILTLHLTSLRWVWEAQSFITYSYKNKETKKHIHRIKRWAHLVFWQIVMMFVRKNGLNSVKWCLQASWVHVEQWFTRAYSPIKDKKLNTKLFLNKERNDNLTTPNNSITINQEFYTQWYKLHDISFLRSTDKLIRRTKYASIFLLYFPESDMLEQFEDKLGTHWG